jgi:monoamine oxidase
MNIYSILNQRYGTPASELSRREFLRTTLLTGAGLLLGQSLLSGATITAPASDPKKSRRPKRVLVVGAGLAGLSCAYELLNSGFDVTLIEARPVLGGRVQTISDLISGKTVEAGGELIGANHPAWLAYAKKFQLKLVDASEDSKSEIPIVIDGRRLNHKEAKSVWEEMHYALKLMNRDATMVNADAPWKSKRAEQFDTRTTLAWLDSINLTDAGRRAVTAQLENDNGVALKHQSYLANLVLVKGGGMDKYWTESESLRCIGGNQQLAYKFAEAIGSQRIHLKETVREISLVRPYTRVVTQNKTYDTDYIVLTLPPSVWNTIQIDPVLPSNLRPQMGEAVKYLSTLKEPVWKKGAVNSQSLGNDFAGWTWNSTAHQTGRKEVCLTSYTGGPSANTAADIESGNRKNAYTDALKKRYDRYPATLIANRFIDWQSDPFSRGSCAFPAPREITLIGAQLQKPFHDKLFFAGEHTCYKFVGFMEGALQSGLIAARRIARREQPVPPLQPQPPTTTRSA